MKQTIFNALNRMMLAGAVGLMALPSFAAYRDAVLADSPYRYWTFDAANDQQIFDQVSGGPETRLQTGSGAMLLNHLDLLSGLALGKALAPSGGADYSSVYNGDLDPVGANITGSYAIELWFKSNRTDQPETGLLMIGMNSNHPTLVYDPADHTVRLINGATSTGRASVGGAALGWHHVVIGVLQDGSSNVTAVTARINGSSRAITLGTYNADIDFGAPGSWPETFFGVHGLASVGDKQFYGYVDEVAIYDFGAGLDLAGLNTRMDTLAGHFAAATVAPEFAIISSTELPAIPTSRTTERTLTVENNAASTITLNAINFAGDDAAAFAVQSYPAALGADARGKIVLEITAGATEEDLATTVTIQTSASNPIVTEELKVKAVAPPSDYAADVLATGPAVYYPLDPASFIEGYTGSGTGQVAQEIIGKRINSRLALSSGATTDSLTPQGAGWSLRPNPGQPYNSMYNPSLSPIAADFTGSYAIEFWFRSANAEQGKRGIIRVAASGTPSPAVVYDAEANSIFMFSGSSSTANVTSAVPVSGDPLGWHHVVLGVLQDQTGNVTEVRATIDNQPRSISLGTFNADIAFGPGGSAIFGLGNASGADLADLQFDGLIDEVAIYNFGPVFTSSELTEKMAEIGLHHKAMPTSTNTWTLY